MANRLSVAGKGSKYKLQGAIPAGFMAGFWHGVIAPITLLVSLFNPDVSIFETVNKGKLYEVGFLLGVASVSSQTTITT
mgnify:CR=1 FL=1